MNTVEHLSHNSPNQSRMKNIICVLYNILLLFI